MCIYLTLPKVNLIRSLSGPFLKLQGCRQTDAACPADSISSNQPQKSNPSAVRVVSPHKLDSKVSLTIYNPLWNTQYFRKSSNFGYIIQGLTSPHRAHVAYHLVLCCP